MANIRAVSDTARRFCGEGGGSTEFGRVNATLEVELPEALLGALVSAGAPGFAWISARRRFANTLRVAIDAAAERAYDIAMDAWDETNPKPVAQPSPTP